MNSQETQANTHGHGCAHTPCKNISLKNVLDEVVEITNFIKFYENIKFDNIFTLLTTSKYSGR